MKTRTRLFNRDFPKGQLFYDTDEVDRALKEGWVDAEHKVGQESKKPKVLENFVTEVPLPPKRGIICACGCGKEIKKQRGVSKNRKYFSQECYQRHKREMKHGRR